MSRQFKVAIVVDHPLRDLPSCTLVGAYLAKAGIDVHLVPMNWQSREIFALAPDLVLLNYVRKNNELLIEKMIDAGIQYGMLDTEGGFYGDLQKYTRLLSSKRNVIEGIRINCVWGDVFFKMWRDDIGVKEETLFLTGLPRFDFYAPEWGSQVIKWLPESWQDSQPLFLLNTKVAIANPQFSTTEQELKMYRDVFKLPEEEIQRHLKLGRASIEQNCQLARDLASDFTNSRVLIRPHPHERVATYSEKIGGNRPNLSADCSGAVVPWIVRSSALIHRQCTTAVECNRRCSGDRSAVDCDCC